ncbi:hypothetical protein PPL_11053 [Heterostelium album PN500]|uniref:Uncharacterized protein n=1 Tax=Heterostelium pallidum (strain ATCC 26659 / Pp 5 / PN500) TaxID=670386 RepID=D3BST3_HETP5|nr:hypothetical protein PPL_11053 [Heterostelium album PN500]EFA75548.1 hypothetical protein PPL_11053 [Heterostelium album PN500]|eukprot:XP_020427682.1 hypothetical protein PPL_11053 [Heterostelium album PN500]
MSQLKLSKGSGDTQMVSPSPSPLSRSANIDKPAGSTDSNVALFDVGWEVAKKHQ